jgi:hypothetical protein
MIVPFLPLIASVATYFVNLFIKDKAKQEEYRLKVLQAVDSYNATALDSAKLRSEYVRLKNKLKAGPTT